MFRTAGYVFLVLAIGSLAIAWSGRSVSHTPRQAGNFVPESQYSGPTLPAQEVNDMTFVYTNER
jgi:hypothetical protein